MPASQPAILVLSPVAESRERLREWLAPLGRECRLLADGDALWSALWQARLGPPALLVLDGHPPEDSYPLINRLQGDQAGAHLPVLLLTDNVADSSRRFYAELLLGVETLPKPVSPESLRARASACLALDEGRRRIEASLAGADWSQTLREGLMAMDAQGCIRYANRQAARLLRMTPLGLCGLNLMSLMDTPVEAVDARWQDSPLACGMADGTALDIKRLALWRGDGGSLPAHAALIRTGDEIFTLLFAFRPAAQDEQQQNVAGLARIDLLTGLPTRIHLEEAMAGLLHGTQRPALLLMDIDHLRHVNETLGYDFGDQLLRAVAARLRGAREPGLLVSMGGGRFGLLADDVADFRVAGRLAQRLQAQFRLPFLLAGHEVFCSISIGIAMHPVSGDDNAQLLLGAERALERAKAVGRNVIQFDSAELNRFSIERLEREAAFHQALLGGELQLGWRLWRGTQGQLLAVQPRAVWPEALPGSPDPGVLAEECGLGRELSDWLFRQAASCSDLPQPLPPGLNLAFTVPAPQVLDPFVVQRLRAWLHRNTINPAQVFLLIPWRENEASVLLRRLPELAAEGVRLALYLNGHGSALDAFSLAPWQAMVLGRDYLRRLPAGQHGLDIVGAMVEFGRRLGLSVFAEGLPPQAEPAALFAVGISGYSEDTASLPPGD
jgi:diguanylate cyclase (GGDEF)-like protein